MNYCQFRNDVIKRMINAGGGLLPAEYQQVEYLEGTGTQYIDTGITSYSSEWEYSGRVYGVSGNATFVTFTDFSGNSNCLGIWYNGGTFLLHISNACRIYSVPNPCEFTMGAKKITYNGNTTTFSNAATYTITAPLLLFKASNSNALFRGRVYYFSIKNGDDKELDYIPCYRKSDSKPGMYDLVTNTFFTNAGSGEFTVGQDV